MSQPLAPVGGPVSLEKLAYDAIKDAILSFRLKPNESLVESDLARQLGISKTPVRDALLRLEKEGFVTKFPYKGYNVMDITRDSVEEMFQIRAVLEGLAVRLAVQYFSDADIQKAKEIIAAHQSAVSSENIKEASKLNRQFHDMIIDCSGNNRLKQMLSNLDDHLHRYRTLSTYQSGRLEKSVTEHQQVLEAIQNRKPNEAEKALRTHILSVLVDLEDEDFQKLAELASDTSKDAS